MKWHENVYSAVFWVADHKSSVIIAKVICLNNLTCKMKIFSLTFNLRYQGHTVHLPLLRKTRFGLIVPFFAIISPLLMRRTVILNPKRLAKSRKMKFFVRNFRL